jgi:hypothetical protein
MSRPTLLATGEEAHRRAARVLPTATSVTVQSNLGLVELRSRTVWSGDRVLIDATTMRVVYMIGDRLYEWSTGDFIRVEFLDALGRGASRASHWVPIAQAEIALLQGLLVPWYLLLGIAAAKVCVIYTVHKTDCDRAFRLAPKVVETLSYLRSRHSQLFNKLAETAARDIITNLPAGVTAEDIAFFVGRVMKGVGGAPEVTLGVVTRIVATVAAIVTATHLPGIAAHAAADAAQRTASDLRAQLAARGMHISDAEARAIYQDLRNDETIIQKLNELEHALRELAPVLERLKGVVRST